MKIKITFEQLDKNLYKPIYWVNNKVVRFEEYKAARDEKK